MDNYKINKKIKPGIILNIYRILLYTKLPEYFENILYKIKKNY